MSEKRPAEEESQSMKYTRIKLASPSPERTSESDTESIHSYQGYKTELVKDTSDTSSSSHSHLNNIEFEVTDVEETKFNYYFSDDSNDVEDKYSETVKPLVISDSLSENFDDALFGDTSEENPTSPTSNSDCDPGLPRNDYLDFERCLLCKTDKKDISYPYCSVCFKWKRNFFPSRPRRGKKKYEEKESILKGSKIKNENESKAVNENGFKAVNENKFKAVNENESKVVNENESLGAELCEDSGIGTSETQQSEDVVDGPSTSNGTSSSSVERLCKVCFCKVESGLFVHLKVAHLYGCYNCATKIWYSYGGCPLCRRKVFKITKLL